MSRVVCREVHVVNVEKSFVDVQQNLRLVQCWPKIHDIVSVKKVNLLNYLIIQEHELTRTFFNLYRSHHL